MQNICFVQLMLLRKKRLVPSGSKPVPGRNRPGPQECVPEPDAEPIEGYIPFVKLVRIVRRGLRLTGGFDQLAAFYFARRQLVFITPDPRFSGLNGANEWMPRVMKVLRGVLVF